MRLADGVVWPATSESVDSASKCQVLKSLVKRCLEGGARQAVLIPYLPLDSVVFGPTLAG